MNSVLPWSPAQLPSGTRLLAVEDLCFYAALGLTLLGLVLAPFRYLAYGTPYLCIIAILARNRIFVPRETWPFLLLVGLGLLAAPWATPRGFKDLYFILSGVSIALAFGDRRLPLRILLGVMVLGHLTTIALHGSALSVPNISVLQSASPFESSFSFLFGLVAVAAIGLGRRWLALFALLAAIASFKRIVVAAVLACAFVWLLPERLRRAVLNPVVALVLTWGYLMLVIAFTRGTLDVWLHDNVGLSANAFTMGRQHLWGPAVAALQENLPRYLLLGDGPGAAYRYLLDDPGLGSKANLHSDILKILIEYGGLTLSAFLMLLYSARSTAHRLLALYTHLLLFTDNVLIYQFYLFFYVLMCRAVDPAPGPGRALIGPTQCAGITRA